MKKTVKMVGIVFGVILLIVVLFMMKTMYDAKLRQQDQELMIKTDDELMGQHIYIKREDKDDIDVNLYLADKSEPAPLVINLHGGAFVAGDADALDTQSDRIAKAWNCTVLTVNYKLMKDGITKQYAVDEVKDAVKYMIAHVDEYNIDTDSIFILGYSAGGYHAMASCLQLHKEGITVKGQILCYPFISDMLEQYAELTIEQQKTIPSALFILAGDEPIGKGSLTYKTKLDEMGVSTELITYNGALHGFIEENNPEYEKLHFHDSKSPEQEELARKAENDMKNWIAKQLPDEQ